MRIVNLGDIATYINGYAFKPTDWEVEGLPIIRIQNLNNPKQEFNYFNGNIADKYVVRHGDILISWSASIGVFEWDREDAVLNQHIFKVVFDKEKINKTYFKFMVSIALDKAMQYMHGSTMKHITKGYFDAIPMPVPDLETQEKIAQILKKSQQLLNAREKQLQACDELIKSQFIEMFGDPISNPRGWEKKLLGNECDIVTGNTPSRKIAEYYGDYIEWIKSDNINTPSATLTTATEYLSEQGLQVGRSVESGSILMTCIAGSIKCIGNVGIADRPVSFNQQINAVVPKKHNTWFMYEMFKLSQPYIQSTINMSLKGILSKGQLSELEFIFPPIELQNQFGEFVQQVDKLKFDMKQSLAELENNFNALMQKAFKGELF
ncbi:MAG: restriction endonuclease subunit S [Cellulosilyticaceae bacterium]